MAGFGMRIAGSQGMEGFTGNTNNYPIDPANTNPIYQGDPVQLSAAGVVEAMTAEGSILGVFAGWEDEGTRSAYGNDSNAYRRVWSGFPGATQPMAKVAIPPHSRYVIKGDAAVDWTTAVIGGRHGFTFAAGDTLYGDSRATLGAVSATGPVILQGLWREPGNGWSDDEPLLLVTVLNDQAHASDLA